MDIPVALAAVVEAGPVATALLIALDNARRLRTLSERLDGVEEG